MQKIKFKIVSEDMVENWWSFGWIHRLVAINLDDRMWMVCVAFARDKKQFKRSRERKLRKKIYRRIRNYYRYKERED